MTNLGKLKILGMAAVGLGMYATYQWWQEQKRSNMLMGYLRKHVQYHKDNNIPFGP